MKDPAHFVLDERPGTFCAGRKTRHCLVRYYLVRYYLVRYYSVRYYSVRYYSVRYYLVRYYSVPDATPGTFCAGRKIWHIPTHGPGTKTSGPSVSG